MKFITSTLIFVLNWKTSIYFNVLYIKMKSEKNHLNLKATYTKAIIIKIELYYVF